MLKKIRLEAFSDVNFPALNNHMCEKMFFSPSEVLSWKKDEGVFRNISDEDIYAILLATSKIGLKDLSPNEVFTQEEQVELARVLKRDIKLMSELLVLQNVTQLADNQWLAKISVAQLAMLLKKELIWADPDIQRQSRVITSSAGEVLREVYVNKRAVKEIADLIANGQFAFNTIRINLVDDGENEPLFNKVDNTILMPETGDLIVLDGNHRTTGALKAYVEYPELRDYFNSVYFSLIFTFFNKVRAREIVVQEATVQKFSKKQYSSLRNSYANYIVEEIRKSENAESIYSKKIVNTQNEIKAGAGFIEFPMLSSEIEKVYSTKKILTNKDAKSISEWLISFFNVIANQYPDVLSDYRKTSKENWLLRKQTWGAFVHLSKVLMNDSHWEQKLTKIITNVDWRISATPYVDNHTPAKQIASILSVFMKRLEG